MDGSDNKSDKEVTILFVDDTHDILESMVDLLISWGYRTLGASCGQEAIDSANRHKPDIVISDISMPDIDGYEVARAIRAQPWGRKALLIAHSGVVSDDSSDAAVSAGFDVFVPKPTDFARLRQILSTGGRYS